MEFCANCGAKLPEGAEFCAECGWRKGGGANQQSSVNNRAISVKPVIFLALIIAIVLIVGFIVFGVINKKDAKLLNSSVKESVAAQQTTEAPIVESTIHNNKVNSANESFANAVNDAYLVSWYKSDTKVDEMTGVMFGTYPQDSTAKNSSKPIEWLVLAKDEPNKKVLLISKYILDCKNFNEDGKATSWENCTLRYWLNNDFLNRAFTNDEINKIQPTLLNNAGNAAYKVYGGNNTNDKIFELSIDEVELFFAGGTVNAATKGTDYAKTVDNDGRNLWVYSYAEDTADDKQFYEWADGNSTFWLRSPGISLDTAACVARGGEIVKYGYGVHSQVYGIRPAMWVSY